MMFCLGTFKKCFVLSATALLLLAGFVSCSVKEERMGCPTWVTVISKVAVPEEIQGILSLFVYRNGSQELYDEYDVNEFRTGFDISFTKGDIELAGVVGWPREYFSGDLLLIPYGEDCPRSWGFYDALYIEPDVEELYVEEELRDLSATVNVCILGAGEDYPYGLVVEGDVDGYHLASLKPHHGPFLCVPDQVSGDDYENRSCRVPRQDDGNLSVSLVSEIPSFLTKAEEPGLDYAFSVPLGDVLAENGYDWDATRLEDIDVLIDFSGSRIVISVSDWTRVLLLNGHYVI